jgi:hypothetical protein
MEGPLRDFLISSRLDNKMDRHRRFLNGKSALRFAKHDLIVKLLIYSKYRVCGTVNRFLLCFHRKDSL